MRNMYACSCMYRPFCSRTGLNSFSVVSPETRRSPARELPGALLDDLLVVGVVLILVHGVHWLAVRGAARG
jgi:hypothetical protein